jgi:hypothetical protein
MAIIGAMKILDDLAGWRTRYQAEFLAEYNATGKLNWKVYNRPVNQTETPGKPTALERARVVLISSSGAWLPPAQNPFDAGHDLGDYSIRRIPVTVPLKSIAYAHTHYDHAAVNADPQVLVPLNHLDDLVAEGRLGDLAADMISFMGYQPDVQRVVEETCPAVVAAAMDLKADAALLVPS